VLLVGLAVVAGAQRLVSWLSPDHLPFLPAARPCVVTVGHERVALQRDQAANAATVAGVGVRLGMPAHAVTIALATAMQESKLHNLRSGDRDSLGLFQQRPSQGWGTTAEIRDPVHAATRFYQALRRVSGWQSMPLTEAAQAVQRSALPAAYAKHEADARTLAVAFTGQAQAAVTCRIPVPQGGHQALTSTGLTPRAQHALDATQSVWGRESVGGFAPGGVSSGHMEGSAHYEGRAVDVFFRPADATHRREGWALAHWLVTNAPSLRLATVIYDDRIWTAARSKEGWRPYRSDDPSNAIKQHRDHVHLDVVP